MKVCSRLFEFLKEYFDYLKNINSKNLIIEQFIDAIGCRSEVETYLRDAGFELMKKIREELMKPLYSVIRTQPASMSGPVYGKMMKDFQPVVIDFSQFEAFYVQSRSLTGDYKSIVVGMMNRRIFSDDYSSRIDALSPDLSFEDHTQIRGEIYADAMRNIEELCLELVCQWTRFHNSDINWTYDESGFFHIPSQTYHETTSVCLPYYLGTSVLIEEDPSDSLPSKGKKQKGKPQENKVPEEKPQGNPVHVFMNGQSGEIFTVQIPSKLTIAVE